MSLKCTMVLGDCLDVMPEMPGDSVDLFFADLPYGATKFSWDIRLPWDSLRQKCDYVGKSAPKVLTANEGFMFRARDAWRRDLRYMLIWDRNYPTGAFTAATRPMTSHEYVMIFGPTTTYNPQKTHGHIATKKTGEKRHSGFTSSGSSARSGRRYDLDTTRNPRTILRFDRDKRCRRSLNRPSVNQHPSQKPVALLDWLIRTYSNPNNNVLDPTAGSFTTCVAACLSGRSSVGIERDISYFEAGVERVRKVCRDSGLDVQIEVRR